MVELTQRGTQDQAAYAKGAVLRTGPPDASASGKKGVGDLAERSCLRTGRTHRLRDALGAPGIGGRCWHLQYEGHI